MVEENKGSELAPGEGEVTPTPAEERALADGWRPLDEWDGEEEEWVDAKSFNFRGELMGRISQQGRKLSALEADNAALSKMVGAANANTKKMVEDAYQRAVRDLKAERREAIREGDHDRVEEIEEQVDELKEAHTKAETSDTTQPQEPQAPDRTKWSPQQNAWYDMVSTTPWLQSDPEVFKKALEFADGILTHNPTMPVGDFIGQINDFGKNLNKRPSAPGPDDGKGGQRNRKSRAGKFSKADLSEMEAGLAQAFVDDGTVKNLDEYAQLLGKDGNLENQR